MSHLLALFANNILPIFLAASAGFILSKAVGLEPRPISAIQFHIFSPCLLFHLLTTSEISGGDIARMVGFSLATIVAFGLLAVLAGLALRLERGMLAAMVLVVMFTNAGNYGLSVSLFSFGEVGLAYASLYFVTMVVCLYTVGVVIASLGKSGLKSALLGILKVPAVYAAVLGILFTLNGWSLPLSLDRTVTILADAALPLLMVLMGIQLQRSPGFSQFKALSLANGLRLVAAPAVAFGLAALFGIQGAARQAGVLESAMPTAVVITVLATEYDIEPAFITNSVVLSTLLSPLTITPLLAFLGA